MHTELREFKAQIFQALAHPTRIAIVDALREGEAASAKLLADLDVEQANLSQHLAVLRARRVVTSRKVGNQVFTRPRSVLVEAPDLLQFFTHLDETVAMLRVRSAKRSR